MPLDQRDIGFMLPIGTRVRLDALAAGADKVKSQYPEGETGEVIGHEPNGMLRVLWSTGFTSFEHSWQMQPFGCVTH